MRLFVSVELSEELKASVTGTMHELKKAGVKGNYTPKQNLHLTLAFIGDVREAASVREALQGISVKPFRLAFSEMGTFGDLLYVGVKGNQGLAVAARDVRSALDGAGISYDRQKFVPHITLIRKVSGPYKGIKAPAGEMQVRKISLMKSEEKNGKRVYTEIASVE